MFNIFNRICLLIAEYFNFDTILTTYFLSFIFIISFSFSFFSSWISSLKITILLTKTDRENNNFKYFLLILRLLVISLLIILISLFSDLLSFSWLNSSFSNSNFNLFNSFSFCLSSAFIIKSNSEFISL